MTINTYKPNDTARIEAILFLDDGDCEAIDWAGEDLRPTYEGEWDVRTKEGWVRISFGSYLCKGTSGGFYPCDPDEFAKRWVQV